MNMVSERNDWALHWRAYWIHHNHGRNPGNHFAWFRKPFHLSGHALSARIDVTADSRYQLFVNGSFIGRGPARCDPRFQSFDTYDVALHLRPGVNVVGALVYHYGVGTGAYILGAEGLLLQASIRLKTGGSVRIQTDESWLSRGAGRCWKGDVHRINPHQGFREVYDARNAPEGWLRPDYDAAGDARWVPVRVLGRPPLYPWQTLKARDVPMARIRRVRPGKLLETGYLDIGPKRFDTLARRDCLEEIMWGSRHVPVKQPFKGIRGRPVYFLYDMGREISAHYHLSVEAPAGVAIDIGSSERLVNGKMPLPDWITRSASPRTVDRYITRAGRQTWSNAFNWRGLRYLQVVAHPWSEKVRHLRVAALQTTADVRRDGDFSCSDRFLNRLWRMGMNTAECCMQDAIVDNPWREQQQYIGDGRLDNLFIYYGFGDARLQRNLIRQIAQSQGPMGEVQSGYPWSSDQVITEYCALWITALKEYYLFAGDRGFIIAMLPVLRGILQWFQRYLNGIGLLEAVPGWTFIDWVNSSMAGRGRNIREISAGLNLFYLQALLDAAWLARHAGLAIDPAAWESRAARLRHALHDNFWSESQGCYVDAIRVGRRSESMSQHVNALAILLDVALPEQRPSIVSRIWEDGTSVHQPSPYFSFYVFRALAKCQRYDLVLKALRQKWRPMAAAGNETCWETFQSNTKKDGFPESRCQMWSCAPLYELPAEILGVKPLRPAFRLFEVCPTPADLKWARGRVPAPHGLIHVAWERTGMQLHLDLRVPDRCAAIVNNPKGWIQVRPGTRVPRNASAVSRRIYRPGRYRVCFRLG